MNRFAHAVYCDDIRFEVGNKQSLVGVYHGKMFVPTFPVTMPKLCVALWVVTPAENPFQALTLKLLFGNKVVVEAPLPAELFQAQETIVEPPDPLNTRIFTAYTTLQLSPLKVDAPVTLKLRIQTEKEELKAGGLEIELAAQSTEPVSTRGSSSVVEPSTSRG